MLPSPRYLGFKPSYATELVIGVDWEGDGCSVVGAKPFIKTGAYSSFGVDVRVSCEAQIKDLIDDRLILDDHNPAALDLGRRLQQRQIAGRTGEATGA